MTAIPIIINPPSSFIQCKSDERYDQPTNTCQGKTGKIETTLLTTSDPSKVIIIINYIYI